LARKNKNLAAYRKTRPLLPATGYLRLRHACRPSTKEGFSEMKVIDPATLTETRVHAGYCEGDYCCDPEGEVRAYPILFFSRAARVILCRPCWEHENRHRHERGEELGCPEHWPTRDWDAAERYQPLRSARRDDIVASRTDALALLAWSNPQAVLAALERDQQAPRPQRCRRAA
jgi:hypothetical protein